MISSRTRLAGTIQSVLLVSRAVLLLRCCRQRCAACSRSFTCCYNERILFIISQRIIFVVDVLLLLKIFWLFFIRQDSAQQIFIKIICFRLRAKNWNELARTTRLFFLDCSAASQINLNRSNVKKIQSRHDSTTQPTLSSLPSSNCTPFWTLW